MLTYGCNYRLASSDSHTYGSSLDLSPELPIHIFNCFPSTSSGTCLKGTSNSSRTPDHAHPPHPPAGLSSSMKGTAFNQIHPHDLVT